MRRTVARGPVRTHRNGRLSRHQCQRFRHIDRYHRGVRRFTHPTRPHETFSIRPRRRPAARTGRRAIVAHRNSTARRPTRRQRHTRHRRPFRTLTRILRRNMGRGTTRYTRRGRRVTRLIRNGRHTTTDQTRTITHRRHRSHRQTTTTTKHNTVNGLNHRSRARTFSPHSLIPLVTRRRTRTRNISRPTRRGRTRRSRRPTRQGTLRPQPNFITTRRRQGRCHHRRHGGRRGPPARTAQPVQSNYDFDRLTLIVNAQPSSVGHLDIYDRWLHRGTYHVSAKYEPEQVANTYHRHYSH